MREPRLLWIALLLFGVSVQDGLAREYTRLPVPGGIGDGPGEAVLRGEVVYSPKGDLLAVGSTAGIWLYDPRAGRLKARLDAGHVLSVAFAPDGGTLAAGSGRAVQLWEVGTEHLAATLEGHTGVVRSVAYSPDGGTLASGGGDRTIRLWEVGTGGLRATLRGHAGEVESVAFSPDGESLASGGGDYTIRLWDVETGQERAALEGHTGWIESVAFSPGGGILASGGWDGTIRLWDAATGEPRARMEEHGRYGLTGWVWSLAFGPRGEILASGHDHGVRLWDVETGRLRSTLALDDHRSWVSAVAVSPDGRTLASGSRSPYQTVLLWGISPSIEVEARVTGGMGAGLTVEFSRSISGRRASYTWNAPTDPAGRLHLTLYPGVTGLYQARALTAAGEVAGRWYSIPINRYGRQLLELAPGGGTRAALIGGTAAKAAAPAGSAASELYPSAPNPFNAGTVLSYLLAEPGPVRLAIYNLMGQRVRTFVDQVQAAGLYQVSWNGRDDLGSAVAAGVYLARLEHPGGVQTRRLIHLK